MTDKIFQAKAKAFQDQFQKLFNAHTALLTGDTEESKNYRAYIARLGEIKMNQSLSQDAQDDLLVEEQEYGAMSYVAEELAADDHDLFANLYEAISRHELIVALVDVANNPPKKPRARKPRAAAAA